MSFAVIVSRLLAAAGACGAPPADAVPHAAVVASSAASVNGAAMDRVFTACSLRPGRHRGASRDRGGASPGGAPRRTGQASRPARELPGASRTAGRARTLPPRTWPTATFFAEPVAFRHTHVAGCDG